LKIALSLVGAGTIGFCVFVLLEATLPGAHAQDAAAVLFRFQLSSMMAMAVFAGLAIVIYVRLSRNSPSSEHGSGGHSSGRNKQSLRK
jgi:hypothetical protein